MKKQTVLQHLCVHMHHFIENWVAYPEGLSRPFDNGCECFFIFSELDTGGAAGNRAEHDETEGQPLLTSKRWDLLACAATELSHSNYDWEEICVIFQFPVSFIPCLIWPIAAICSTVGTNFTNRSLPTHPKCQKARLNIRACLTPTQKVSCAVTGKRFTSLFLLFLSPTLPVLTWQVKPDHWRTRLALTETESAGAQLYRWGGRFLCTFFLLYPLFVLLFLRDVFFFSFFVAEHWRGVTRNTRSRNRK